MDAPVPGQLGVGRHSERARRQSDKVTATKLLIVPDGGQLLLNRPGQGEVEAELVPDTAFSQQRVIFLVIVSPIRPSNYREISGKYYHHLPHRCRLLVTVTQTLFPH